MPLLDFSEFVVFFLLEALFQGRYGIIVYSEADVTHELKLVYEQDEVVDLLQCLCGPLKPQLLKQSASWRILALDHFNWFHNLSGLASTCEELRAR